MTDRDGLLRAICENPDDDAPRLIYADWLDEHGDPLQAEFIRLQMQHSPVDHYGRDAHPLAARQRELWNQVRRWRFARADWVNFTLGEFVRGFCPNFSGTATEFLRRAPQYWRIGPTDRISLYFWKKADAQVSQARQVAERDWLRHVRAVQLSGDWLSDEWVNELLSSPFTSGWKAFDMCGCRLTDWIGEKLVSSALVGTCTRLRAQSSRFTEEGRALIAATFGASDW